MTNVLSEEDRQLPQVENVLPLLRRGIGIHHGGFVCHGNFCNGPEHASQNSLVYCAQALAYNDIIDVKFVSDKNDSNVEVDVTKKAKDRRQTFFGGSIRIPAFKCGIFGHKPTKLDT
uniref:Uncharacterized protein n=1 Tax=Glossina palpalis gambiensis TaxID=67801 RepID=A0A1B0AVG4_9MUSC